MTRVIAAALAALLGAALLIAPVRATASTAVPTPAPSVAEVSKDGVAPIAVLLDTSGSMNEDDGAGTLKLRGAKNAVRDIVRNLSSTTVFGLRTYPASGGCDEGRYVYEPAPLTGRDAVLHSIEGITADGSTPTGEALRALADDLKNRGYTAATIVLVSDGESTCSTPPCDVAKQLVSEGFDVTVPTIGFRTSAAGSEELACVAEATCGVYLDAGDSAELAEQLDSLVRAQLELRVRYDAAPMSDGSTKMTAIITHKGGEDAKDVRVSLTFSNSRTPEQRRAGIPPVVRVGNIPVGTSVERSWTIGTGVVDATSTTRFTMSAWGTNAVRAAFEGEYRVREASFSKSDLGAPFDGVSIDNPVVIFGDSYSSGEGVGDGYQAETDAISYDCHRNADTYLGTVLSEAEMRIVACSGAVTAHLRGTSDRASRSQIQQMTDLGVAPSVGVMTFGGNDIGFADVVTMCIHPLEKQGCMNESYQGSKITAALQISTPLSKTYRAAWAAMNTPEMRAKRGGTYAPLIVLPYPQILHETKNGSCYQFNSSEVSFANSLGDTINRSVETGVKIAASQGYEVYFASGVEGAVRPDHTLCESGDDAFINGWVFTDWKPTDTHPESVHPKASGYEAVTGALIQWSKTAERFAPSVSDEAMKQFTDDLLPPLESTWTTTIDIQSTANGQLFQGGSVQIQGGGLQAASSSTVVLHSDPTVLGSVLADMDGKVDETFVLPADIPPGQHTLVISALSADGEFIEKRIPVAVLFPTPWWVWGALALALALLLSAVALVLVGWSIRKRDALPAESS